MLSLKELILDKFDRSCVILNNLIVFLLLIGKTLAIAFTSFDISAICTVFSHLYICKFKKGVQVIRIFTFP